jgi:hypothetical protein
LAELLTEAVRKPANHELRESVAHAFGLEP